MDVKDSTANVVSLTGMTMSFMNFETMLTIVVLFSALALNIVRIYEIWKKRSTSSEEDPRSEDTTGKD